MTKEGAHATLAAFGFHIRPRILIYSSFYCRRPCPCHIFASFLGVSGVIHSMFLFIAFAVEEEERSREGTARMEWRGEANKALATADAAIKHTWFACIF